MYSFTSTLAFAHVRDYVALDSRLHSLSVIPCSRAESVIIAAAVNRLTPCGWTDNRGDCFAVSASAEVIRDRAGYSVHITRQYLKNAIPITPGQLAAYVRKIEKASRTEERESAYIPASVRLA